jgi:hypothetical protein
MPEIDWHGYSAGDEVSPAIVFIDMREFDPALHIIVVVADLDEGVAPADLPDIAVMASNVLRGSVFFTETDEYELRWDPPLYELPIKRKGKGPAKA